jgi:hypothetical protein
MIENTVCELITIDSSDNVEAIARSTTFNGIRLKDSFEHEGEIKFKSSDCSFSLDIDKGLVSLVVECGGKQIHYSSIEEFSFLFLKPTFKENILEMQRKLTTVADSGGLVVDTAKLEDYILGYKVEWVKKVKWLSEYRGLKLVVTMSMKTFELYESHGQVWDANRY